MAKQPTKKKKGPIIELKKVWKIYVMGKDIEVPALCGLDLAISPGEFIAIMGPSGSGKSTAMHLVGSLDIPTKGQVFLNGIDISTLGESELARIRGQQIGFIFQKFNLINSMDALENVKLPMMFNGYGGEKRDEIARTLLGLVGLSHRMHHRPTELSGGEQQRVAIARALANDPPIILADEPTGNLDTATGDVIMKLLVDLHKRGKTIIVVTHDADIAAYAERRLVLRDGKIVKDGHLHGRYAGER